MKLLATLHRWTGGIVGLLLAVLGLTGTALIWEEAWIGIPGADAEYTSTPATIANALQVASAREKELGRVTLADENFGLHQAIYRDGSGAYIDQAGRIVDRWDSMWGRPELWLFDIHHYLLMGPIGENIAGVLGLLLLAFTVTGAILWWRTRKTFAFRIWPKRMSRSAIVRQHRDIGVVASPLLLVSALSGTMMLFQPMSDALLAPWSNADKADEPAAYQAGINPNPDFAALMVSGQAAFPDAMPRRLQMPKEPGEPAVLRLRQDSEWTPNGRSYAFLDPASGALLGVDDPRRGSTQQWIEEKYYPVHAGKVGGVLWKLALTFGGLTLVLLGTLASWTFWFRRNDGRVRPVAVRQPVAIAPAE